MKTIEEDISAIVASKFYKICPSKIDDAVQYGYMKYFQGKNIQHKVNFIIKSAINHIIDNNRKKDGQSVKLPNNLVYTNNPLNQLIEQEEREIFDKAKRSLTQEERDFLERYLAKMGESATIERHSDSVRFSRIKKKLRIRCENPKRYLCC